MDERATPMLRDVLLLTLLVLCLRLPFLHQAIGGDDVYYLASAYHALIDPLHPNHTTYVFEGKDVTFQGYPHPPGNAWILAGLVTLFGDVRAIPFHAVYLLFSLGAVYGLYALARRFSRRPLWAAALFTVVPAFCVNGNTLESDLPLLAFWMLGAALFVYATDHRSTPLLAASGVCLAACGLIAMQSFLFTPILLVYWWTRPAKKRWSFAAVTFAPILTLAAWQLLERASSGQFPAAISAGYLSSYGYQRVAIKLRNAAALSVHACFLVFPILLPFAVGEAWRKRRDRDVRFLIAWTALFFVAACAIFYAGSARYLLPVAAPVVLLAASAPLPWIRSAFVIQAAISVGLATANFEQWNAYRTFSERLRGDAETKRVWVDAEWGLRHYLEAEGALPWHVNQTIPAGDIVVQSELASPAPIAHGGGVLVPVAEMVIHPLNPFRTIGLDSASAFSTDSEGFLPYDFRAGVIDRVQAFEMEKQEPKLERLAMDAPGAESQIVSGIYQLEGAWRWMGAKATVLLKCPHRPATLQVSLYIPDSAPARQLTVRVLGGPENAQKFPGPGTYTVSLPVDTTHLSPVTVELSVDRTFQPPGDSRRLGVILNAVNLE